MEKALIEQKTMELEKMIVAYWKDRQEYVKKRDMINDFTLNCYSMSNYRLVNKTICEMLSDQNDDFVKNATNTEINGVIIKCDKTNYQKLQQTLRYINDVRHNKNSMILTR